MPTAVLLAFFFNMGAGQAIPNNGYLIFYIPSTGAEGVLRVNA